jgi:aspartyl aminopeptidase
MSHILADFTAFLESSPTAYHAVRQIANRLASLDFIPLDEKEAWHLEKGKRYFTIRGGSLAAFTLPTSSPEKFTILASHTDSPALKIKPNPEVYKENMTFLEVEVYGAPLLYSWLNRDLCIAGRIVVVGEKGEIEEKIVLLDDVPVVIPALAIHLDREVNEKGCVVHKQNHLPPLIALLEENGSQKIDLVHLLRRQHPFRSLLSFDLFLTPLETARFLGPSSELLAAYRIDNLTSVHSALHALALAPKNNAVQMAIFWDHEEIGSRTAEGSASPFLSDLIQRISGALKIGNEDLFRIKANSLCLSIDVSHAYNPNFCEKHDPNHHSLLGKGIAIKYNADQKYATNGLTAAKIVQICQQCNLRYQSFVSRSDIPSGSTVGPIVAKTLGIPTVDLGIPILSMHSIREVMAVQDHLDMCHLLTHALTV